MATARAKGQPVGSTGWIQDEREQATKQLREEAENFNYSVKNELEWLNEHMGEIFSKNQVNIADIFKTPGKLRGKTPRTARKQFAQGPRQPLSDIFAPNVPAPQSAQKTAFFDKIAQFQISEDAENQPAAAARPTSRANSPQRIGKPGNTDSGYHGMMTEDEMDVDSKTETATQSSQQSTVQKILLRDNQQPPQRLPDVIPEIGDSSNDSFASAKEELTSRNVSKEQLRDQQNDGNATVVHDDMEVDQEISETPAVAPAVQEIVAEAIDNDQDMDDEISRSDASSPEKPLQRKSSFTFTALPAREPLTGKRSVGVRNSQADTGRESTLEKAFGGKSTGPAQDDDEDEDYVMEKSEESKAHNKTSTQLLHERITMLGKTKELRPSRSIPPTALGGQTAYPQLPSADKVQSLEDDEDSDDDWIAPTKPTQQTVARTEEQQPEARQPSPERPTMHQKAISTTHIPSPSRPEMTTDSRQQKAISVSNPNFAHAMAEIQSTTPAGSPPRKKSHDGPLSASKSKLYSVLKSAKSIFASSANASAAAKLEAHNNSPSRSPTRNISDESKTAAVFNMPGALYSDKELPQSPSRPVSVVSASPSKKSRKSDESDKKREKDLKAQQKATDDLEKMREKERQKAAKQQEEKQKAQQKQQPERPPTAESDKNKDEDMPPPPPPKSGLMSGKLRAPGRLVKPTREQAPAAKPAPVAIRIASQSQRLGHLSKSQHEASGPAPPSKQAQVRPGSSQSSVRGSAVPSNARVKALESAAKKKEADEKAAREKEEKKREMDRKRAAKVEEERRAEEEKKAAEQQRLQEAKLAAQRQAEKQAADAKKREQQRLEQMKQQAEAQKAKEAHELAEALKRERAQQAQAAPPPRGDVGGTLRQLAKSTVPESVSAQPNAPNRPPVQTNPAKPPKRVWQPEDEDESQRPPQPQQPQRPGMQRGPPSYQQIDGKRRRTNEEEPDAERHSVMAPPKRPSNMRKESTLSKFPHGYTHAPAPANHHVNPMFKAATMAQHQMQHPSKPGMPNHPSQMVQVVNGRIPFAENANPPAATAAAHHYPPAQLHPGYENMQPGATQNKYKTPARAPQGMHSAKSAAKSSPLYPNGDNIQLPEIATDSEDEDSEDEDNTGFRAPSWVASPALRELLTQQQLVNPESVFGPIGELKMDEVFKNSKNPDRLKRLRDRGSSAAWVESGDAVTSAEKRRDMELRERVVKEGGWRYEPNV